jgi:hypothetical protein
MYQNYQASANCHSCHHKKKNQIDGGDSGNENPLVVKGLW